MKSAGASKIGLIRQANEDRFYIGEQFYIVADGMGGYKGGEIASTIAIDDVSTYLKSASRVGEKTLRDAISVANKEILEKVSKEPHLEGMGTTIVVAYLNGDTLYWANVGDSRLYILRDGQLHQISKDHSLVQSLVDSGEIQPEDRMNYPKKNYLTRAVGVTKRLSIDTGHVTILANDKLILCSDGLTSYVDDETIKNILTSDEDEAIIVDKLISSVYEVGARDNITVIVSTVCEE